jgi:ribosomal protein S18 acetylase RimI-like enzyme
MAHVGQLGVSPAWRRKGVAGAGRDARLRACLRLPEDRQHHVRASNGDAQAFYQRLGFLRAAGSKQVVIDGVADDEVMMELHL